jgi:hypothetical protein
MSTGGSQNIYRGTILSDEEKKSIKKSLGSVGREEMEWLVDFLTATIDFAVFNTDPFVSALGKDGSVSNPIPLSEYIGAGLTKKATEWAMTWLTTHTPIRRLQPLPRIKSNIKRSDTLEVVLLFPDLDLAKDILSVVNEKQNIEDKTLRYKDRTLFFRGKEILISGKGATNQHLFFKILFSNKKRKWNELDVLDEFFKGRNWETDEMKKNRFYHYSRAINDKIAKETEVKDFIIATTKTYQINPKYLQE